MSHSVQEEFLGVTGMECCTPRGAARIKAKIEDFWRSKGYYVEITLLSPSGGPPMARARTDIRSDMINGIPRIKRQE